MRGGCPLPVVCRLKHVSYGQGLILSRPDKGSKNVYVLALCIESVLALCIESVV